MRLLISDGSDPPAEPLSKEAQPADAAADAVTVASTQESPLATNMDRDETKLQTYSPNRRAQFSARYIKYASLVILTLQNAILGLSMRYALTRGGEKFSPPAAVLIAEVLKLIICFVLVVLESGGIERGIISLYATVILNIRDTLRVCVPSFLYIVQNNLLYVSSSNLDAATYQSTDGSDPPAEPLSKEAQPADAAADAVTVASTQESPLATNMDRDETKLQTYSPNRRAQFSARYIKYASLVILTLQNAILGLSMRYALTRGGEKFSPPAAVLIAEVLKLIICFVLVVLESGGIERGIISLYATVILNIRDTLRVCVPSFLYIVQNNLLYVSSSNLDAATYQVTYQLKILTTAFFAVVVLKRTLKKWQWGALALLAAGIALVQLSSSDGPAVSTDPTKEKHTDSRVLGFCAALGACFLSGFAGIYFEKVLKESDISVWMRNVQLSLLSLPFGVGTYLIKEGSMAHLLRGFDGFVWYLVVLQAAGGLIVAVVVKYADNILKGFATSVAIIISCIASIYIFSFHLTLQFAVGTVLVIGSIFLYGYVPKKPEHRSLGV